MTFNWNSRLFEHCASLKCLRPKINKSNVKYYPVGTFDFLGPQMLGSHTFLSIKTAEIFVCSISSWNITMKVTALMLLLALAVNGQDHDANNRQPKAPFFFNPLTLTIYSTNRAVSTSYVACLTQQAGLPVPAPACRRRRSLEEEAEPQRRDVR